MKAVDLTKRFEDNSYARELFKAIVLHWTVSGTAQSAIDWLDQRLEGKGTVVYNYIIDRDGTIYVLVDPRKRWAYHSGTNAAYDKQSISVAFVSWGIQGVKKDGTCWEAYKGGWIQQLSTTQVEAIAELYSQLTDEFGDIPLTHHAAINSHKIDLTPDMFEQIKRRIFEPRITRIGTDKKV